MAALEWECRHWTQCHPHTCHVHSSPRNSTCHLWKRGHRYHCGAPSTLEETKAVVINRVCSWPLYLPLPPVSVTAHPLSVHAPVMAFLLSPSPSQVTDH